MHAGMADVIGADVTSTDAVVRKCKSLEESFSHLPKGLSAAFHKYCYVLGHTRKPVGCGVYPRPIWPILLRAGVKPAPTHQSACLPESVTLFWKQST
jgi:hypothetical protein